MYIAACIFSVFCSLILPLGCALALCIRKRTLIRPLLLGAACFTVFQLFIRLPILQLVLPKMAWFALMSAAQPLLYCSFLGVTAGLFEELGRYIVMALFMKKRLSAAAGIGFGLGHGGIEAILLVGINSAAALFMAPMAEPGMILAGGVERLSAMLMHVAWSVLVMKSLRDRKPLLLLWAVLGHTLVDIFAAWALYMALPVWGIEAALMLCALWAFIFIKKEYEKEKMP